MSTTIQQSAQAPVTGTTGVPRLGPVSSQLAGMGTVGGGGSGIAPPGHGAPAPVPVTPPANGGVQFIMLPGDDGGGGDGEIGPPGAAGPQGPTGPGGVVIYDAGTPSTDFSVGFNVNCGGVT